MSEGLPYGMILKKSAAHLWQQCVKAHALQDFP